jgi:C1A family cysteine protease
MRKFLTFLLAVILLAALPEIQSAQTHSSVNSAAVASMQRKLEHVQSNGALAHPDTASTEFSEQEINAYFASGSVKLPAGVQSATFQGQPGIVTSTARVDFDQLKTGRNSSNPLLSVFTGVHDVVVVAHAHGIGGQGFVHVDSVSLDGVEIPAFVLQIFVQKYLQPRYPNIGLDSRFALPDRVDTATVGLHTLTLTQK